MASKNFLNLTLDEIIQSKKSFGKSQNQNRSKNSFGRLGNFQPKFSPKKNLSLASRLSRRGEGFRPRAEFRRNGTVANQLDNNKQRISVYSRLTLNKPQRPVNLLQGSVKRSPLKTKNIKTRNAEEIHPVRITNGAIVKGLRSDQLLLQKLSQHRNRNLQAKVEKLRALQVKKSQTYERSERKNAWRGLQHSKVSMNLDHGLTVSIANEVAKRARAAVRRQRPVTPSSSSSSSEEEPYPPPSSSRRISEVAKDPISSILRLGSERPPPPKPHRQVLDPQVQKEIAALQGHADPKSVGPGPGVKGFKMIPNRTKNSLNERFTIEKAVND